MLENWMTSIFVTLDPALARKIMGLVEVEQNKSQLSLFNFWDKNVSIFYQILHLVASHSLFYRLEAKNDKEWKSLRNYSRYLTQMK